LGLLILPLAGGGSLYHGGLLLAHAMTWALCLLDAGVKVLLHTRWGDPVHRCFLFGSFRPVPIRPCLGCMRGLFLCWCFSFIRGVQHWKWLSRLVERKEFDHPERSLRGSLCDKTLLGPSLRKCQNSCVDLQNRLSARIFGRGALVLC